MSESFAKAHGNELVDVILANNPPHKQMDPRCYEHMKPSNNKLGFKGFGFQAHHLRENS